MIGRGGQRLTIYESVATLGPRSEILMQEVNDAERASGDVARSHTRSEAGAGAGDHRGYSEHSPDDARGHHRRIPGRGQGELGPERGAGLGCEQVGAPLREADFVALAQSAIIARAGGEELFRHPRAGMT